MILDDGGDATLLMHLGKRAEKDASLLANPTSEEETRALRRDQGQAGASTPPGTAARARRSSA